MAQVICPQCERQLCIPDEVSQVGWRCSDCRSKVAIPQSEEDACPRCGKPVQAVFRFCPHCEAVLQGKDRGSQGGKLDDLVHRQGSRFRVGITLLAVIGGLGLTWCTLAAMGSAASSKDLSLVYLAAGVSVLVLSSTGIMFYRTRGNPGARGIGRVVVGTLALAGGLMAFSCVLGAAVGLFFFAACMMGY
jgi:hypothetical protein